MISSEFLFNRSILWSPSVFLLRHHATIEQLIQPDQALPAAAGKANHTASATLYVKVRGEKLENIVSLSHSPFSASLVTLFNYQH
jgi:hypothetical protein